MISEFTSYHQQHMDAYRTKDSYPSNMPVEIRVSGLDRPGDVGIEGARTVALSAIRPRTDHPEWDVAVWFDILTIPGTADATRFYRETETWMYRNYSSYAMVRPEWSKGWGYGTAGAWSDPTMFRKRIPNSFRSKNSKAGTWTSACRTLDTLDPKRVFSSPLHRSLMPPT